MRNLACLPLFLLLTLSCLTSARADVILENREFRLVISDDARAKSLLHLKSGEECLATAPVPLFTATQYRPYDNEVQLAFPARPKTYPSRGIRKTGNELIVNFDVVNYDAVIGVTVTDSYIAFKLLDVKYHDESFRYKREVLVDETVFLQLPVKSRTNFGEWLNVMWDQRLAVNLLGTDPFARIDSDEIGGGKILRAGAVSDVKLRGVGAALIVTETSSLLDRIAQVERDFHLPGGVASRRRPEQKFSYYWVPDGTPENIDEHIRYAKQGGFKLVSVYRTAFSKTAGNFPWKPEYPRGMADLQAMIAKIKQAGLIPGFHFHYNKAQMGDPYITPVPDDRLNALRTFTLSGKIGAEETTIQVLEDPYWSPHREGDRLLKIGKEIVSYQNYTTSPPYQFTGCKRGELQTSASVHSAGEKADLLDSDWGTYLRFNQRTDIQEETARRIADIYRQAGFQFAYYDGAEDVHQPYWFWVGQAQYSVESKLDPEPLFAEGACKSHFSWHILTRGNAFDVFRPEIMKQSCREHPASEAPRIAADFTKLNFGWMGFTPADRDNDRRPAGHGGVPDEPRGRLGLPDLRPGAAFQPAKAPETRRYPGSHPALGTGPRGRLAD